MGRELLTNNYQIRIPAVLGIAWLPLATFYFANVIAGGFGQGLALIPGISISFWPPAGIFVAALLLNPSNRWPWYVLTAGLAELTCNAIWFHNPVYFALVYFLANACEALTAAWLIRRFAPRSFQLDSLFEVAAFILLGGLIAPLVGATIIAGVDAIRGRHSFATAWPLVWLGDGSGLLVSTPLTLVLVQAWRERERISSRVIAEATIAVAVLIVLGAISLHGDLPTVYLALPPLIWLAARFQLKGATAGLGLITLMTALTTMLGRGEFSGQPELMHENVIMLQTFLSVSAISAFIVAALAVQYQQALNELQAANTELEYRVGLRTASLQASEERFRLAADAVNGIIYEFDLQNGHVERSRGLYEVLGYQVREVPPTATWWAEQIHPDDREHVLHFAPQSAARYITVNEYRVRHKDGHWLYVEDRALVLKDDVGQPVKMVGCTMDITARKLAETEQKQTLSTLNSLIASAPVGIVLFDLDMRFRHINGQLAEMNGLPAEAHLGRTVKEVVPELYDQALPLFNQVLHKGLAVPDFILEEETSKATGLRRAWRESWFPVMGTDGRPSGVGAIVQEVTEQRRTETALRDGEQRMRLATEATGLGIWEWNVASNQIRWDAHMFKIYGVPATGDGIVPYGTWREAVLPEDLSHQEEVLQATIQRQRTSCREFRIRRSTDGEIRTVQSVETVRTNVEGQVEWVVGTNLDVTEKKRAEDELRRLAEKLTEADRRKDEFLSTLAHELRNPLAPLRNGLEILKLTKGDASVSEETCAVMDRQLLQMVRLIDDLMDVSRISSGKVVLRKERIILTNIIQQAVETSLPLIETNGHNLAIDVPVQELAVDGDATRLAQVLSNLLNNAAKYSERGGRIMLKVERQGSDVLISVKDTGIGIPTVMLPKVFDLFTQVDRSLEKSQGGLGIGLSLVKRLVDMHDGHVEAKSEGEGKGSEFVVRLPIVLASLTEQQRDEAAKTSETTSLSLRILVADDNQDSANSLSLLLRMMGNETQTAHDGIEAVAIAESFRPEVILLDIGMPKLNGYDACRIIREQTWGKEIVLLAMTGWGQDDDKRKSQEAGFDAHLVKPLSIENLEKTLQECQYLKKH